MKYCRTEAVPERTGREYTVTEERVWKPEGNGSMRREEMREMRFVKTDVQSSDAQMLLEELNTTLVGILGHNGQKHVCLDDFRLDRSFFVIGYDGDTPVCCAGVRRFDDTTGEVKRVFARNNHRGYGSKLMAGVETLARECGYRRLILECREGNPRAIDFYQREGYTICEKYPPYKNETDAVCLEKILP